MQIFIVRGFSEISMADAVSNAMSQVGSFVSPNKDISISVISMSEKENGYEAVLRVVVVPMSEGAVLKPEGYEEELIHSYKREFKKKQKGEEGDVRRRVNDYLMQTHGALIADLPEFDLRNLNVEALYEGAFEQAFDMASQMRESKAERELREIHEKEELITKPSPQPKGRKMDDDLELEPH